MKIKRLIATVLASAMILTSQSFSCPVSAAEVASKEEVVVSDELSTEDASTNTEESSVTEENKDAEEISDEIAEETGSSENVEDKSEATELTEDEASGEDEEVLEENSENEEVEEEELPEEEALEEETLAEEELPEEEEGFELLKSTDYFDVDSGTLKIKDGIEHLQKEVYIPANCETIPDNIFKNNRDVQVIRFDLSYDDAGTEKYEQLLSEIAPGAFEGSSIEKIEGLPFGVSEIPDNAFYNSNLSTITFQSSADTSTSSIINEAKNITSIGSNAFKGTKLTSVVNYSACEIIGSSAFEDCNLLTEAIFGIVENIGTNAFADCSSLARFNNSQFPDTLSSIGSDAFKGVGITEADLRKSTSLTQLNPNTFKDCPNLVAVYLPLCAVNNIPTGFLAGCKKLTTIGFPEDKDHNIIGIETISSEAFKDCSALEEVDLKLVYSIGSAAFAGCTKLKRIIMNYNSEDTIVPGAPVMYIAPDAFVHYTTATDRKNHTIRAYETEAQVYADQHGYTFETAYDLFIVDISKDVKSKAKITLNKTKAKENEEVEVTVVPAEGYSLTDIRIGDLGADEVILKGCNATKQVFTFKMPKKNVTIYPTLISNKNVASGKIDYYFKDAAGGHESHTDNNEFTIATSGEQHSLVVTSDGAIVREWLFSYASSNGKVATITDKGEIVALTEGWTDITATLIANNKRKIACRLYVGDQIDIVKVEVKNDGDEPPVYKNEGILCNDKRVSVGYEKYVVGGNIIYYPCIQVMKSTTDLGNVSFDVELNTLDSVGNYVKASTSWSSSDTAIAKVKSASTSLNKNTITINKGSLGESLITIYHLNQNEKKPNEKNTEENPEYEDNETKVIVRVVDNTPRVAVSKIEINGQKEANLLPIYAVYDGKIYDDAKLRLYYDAKCTNECSDFELTYVEELNSVNIVTTKLFDKSFKLNAKKDYKNMYLKGSFAENYGDFIVKIGQINLINKPLAPKYTSKNKINLFYNTTADPDEIGKVVITNNLKNEFIQEAYLISKSNYTRHNYDAKEYIYSVTDPDLFYENFSTELEDNVITIRRRVGVDPIYKDTSKKNILSGYLYVKYAGYKYPVMTPYTVPTTNTAPSYVLSMTGATANTNVSGQNYSVYLYKKGDKLKLPISLDKLDEDVDPLNRTGLAFDYNKSTTSCFNEDALRDYIDFDNICLNVSEGESEPYTKLTPKAGKAVIRIHMTTWSDDGKNDSSKYLRYTFTLKTTSAKPKVSFKVEEAGAETGKETKGNKITFNKAFEGEQYNLITSTDQPKDSFVKELSEPVFKGNAAKQPDYEKIHFDSEVDELNNAYIAVTIDDDIAKGTYKFSTIPSVQYVDSTDEPIELKAMDFVVVVGETMPKISFGNGGTFKLNYSKIITEHELGTIVTTNYKLSNLSSLTNLNDYAIDYDVDDVTITPVTKNPKSSYSDFKTTAKMMYDSTLKKVDVSRLKSLQEAFTCKYKVEGLKISSVNGAVTADVAPFNVTIQGYVKVPTLKIKTSGGVDFVNRLSSQKITASLSNVVGAISSVELKEYGPNGSFLKSEDMHFGLFDELGEETVCANPVFLKITNPKGTYDKNNKPDGSKPIKPNTKYKLQLVYTVDTTGTALYKVDFYVTPTQKLPALTVKQTRNYVYAGEQYGYDQKLIGVNINVPKNTQAKYYLDCITAEDQHPEERLQIQWAKNTPDTIKNAFDISNLAYSVERDSQGQPILDDDGHEIRNGAYAFDIFLKNAASLQQNKTYTLNFVAYYEGQATDTNGSPIKIKVNLRK